MAKVSAYQLRKQDKSELQSQLNELKQELMTLRVQKVSGASAGRLTRIKTVKKSIARVLTVINQTQRAKLAEEFKGKKYLPLDLRHKKTRAIRRQLTKHEKGLKTLKQQKKDIHFGARKYAIKA